MKSVAVRTAPLPWVPPPTKEFGTSIERRDDPIETELVGILLRDFYKFSQNTNLLRRFVRDLLNNLVNQI